MLGDERRDLRKLGNRVGGVKLLEFCARDELRTTRIVRTEEVQLAVVEGAAKREAHVVGGAALGLEGVTGEIREGLQADLVVLDLDKPWLRPHNDLIASLCYSMNGSEVELTMVAGKVLYEKGEFLTIDAEETVRRVEASCDRLGTRR